MEKFNLENFIKKNKKIIFNYLVGFLVFGVVAIIYSIIAGIWGFAPIHNMNWKIFGTGAVMSIISGIFVGMMLED